LLSHQNINCLSHWDISPHFSHWDYIFPLMYYISSSSWSYHIQPPRAMWTLETHGECRMLPSSEQFKLTVLVHLPADVNYFKIAQSIFTNFTLKSHTWTCMVMCHKKTIVSGKSSQIYQVHFFNIKCKIWFYTPNPLNVMKPSINIEFMVILNTNFEKLLCNESYNIFVIFI
jgi:hypothetical protein